MQGSYWKQRIGTLLTVALVVACNLVGHVEATVQRIETVLVRVEQKVGNVTINNSSLVYRYRY